MHKVVIVHRAPGVTGTRDERHAASTYTGKKQAAGGEFDAEGAT